MKTGMQFIGKTMLAATAMLSLATAAQAQDGDGRGWRGARGQQGERPDRADRPGRIEQRERFEQRQQAEQRPERRQPEQRAQRVDIDRDMARGGDQTRPASAQMIRPDERADRGQWNRERGAGLRPDAQSGNPVDGARRPNLGGGAYAGQRDDRPYPGFPGANARGEYRGDRGEYRGNGRQNDRGRDISRGWASARADRVDQYRDRARFDDRQAWNRGWREDRQYDWGNYRAGNRSAYRLPRYYAPSGWGYGYRRFSVGITLNSVLFDQNYWIEDPYTYRLPEAYGAYRWVRYYNDALLVDLRYGRVVDTVYDIFW
ncbi:MAG TPA: RcnB family protein [Sphingomonas sp.]|jgi:hypothetical protein|nr:RcnB family protein [Sphingomonas sp.]